MLDWLAPVGPAGLVSLDGELSLSACREREAVLRHIAVRVARACSTSDPCTRTGCVTSAGSCTYFTRIGTSHALFVVAAEGFSPAAAHERLARAAAVFDRVLRRNAGALPGAPSSGGAQATVEVPSGSRHVRRWG